MLRFRGSGGSFSSERSILRKREVCLLLEVM
jgi:hypothetical protein